MDFKKIYESEFLNRESRKRWGRDSIFSGDNLPETINEDIQEEETPAYVRHSRFTEMRDYNEFGKEQKRCRSDDRDKRKKQPRHRMGRIP
jgi:hypothetical protein